MAIFDNLTLILLYFANAISIKFFWLGALAGCWLLALNEEDLTFKKVFFGTLGILSFLPLSAYLFIPKLASVAEINLTQDNKHFAWWVGLAVASFAASIWWLRTGVRKWDVFTENVTAKTTLERKTKTDARTIQDKLPKATEFDPLEYLDKEKGTFLGLINESCNEKEKKNDPVYIPIASNNNSPHIDVIGTTGGGKGILLGILCSQFLERGEAVFFCDPKNDEWAPHVLFDAAKRTGKPYHIINLNRPNGPQFNIVQGATPEECFELFQAGFSLVDKGDSSDFYGIDDREQADITAQLIHDNGYTLAEAYAARLSQHDPDDGGKKFYGKLREMAKMPSINGHDGVDLAKVVEEGGCVYVIGSMRNDIVRTIQRMLFVRLIHLAERRDRMKGELRKICIVLDEVKYHLSKPAQEGLGAARDKGVHLVLAHQSLGDLKDCTKDMNPEAVVDAIVENCKVKIAYQVQNPDTAEWLARMSGKIPVDDETKIIRKNIAKAETVDDDRTIRQSESYLIDENTFRGLHPKTAVLFGSGPAKIISIQQFKVPKVAEAITIKVVEGENTIVGNVSDVEKMEALD